MALNNKIAAVLVSAAFGTGILATGPAFAQETMEAPVEAPAAASYEPAKLQSFVVAFLEVDQINRAYQPRLQEAGDEAAQTAVRDEANQEMMEAVEQVDGISVQEYAQIIQQAQTDPALAQEINGYIQEAVGTPEGSPAE